MKSIRNSDGIWINTEVFRESALYFKKYGYYCPDPWDSPAWFDFWKRERNRCINGYTVGGAKITGDHYFYLNYCPIDAAEKTKSRITKKVKTFPDFWDGDYTYFWCREIAKKGLLNALNRTSGNLENLFNKLFLLVKIRKEFLDVGFNLLVGKSRRKGYSYKSASIAVNNYFTNPNSLTLLNAYEKKYLYPKGIFSMAKDFINFVNLNTAWVTPSDVINKVDHIKSSYITYNKGVKSENGFKSEILALSCKDNPAVNRGKSAIDIFIEEAGAFGVPGLLKKLYSASEDCVKAGNLKTGLITIFGTSGDMDKGTVDFSDMYSRPGAFNLLPVVNELDKGLEDTNCGYFHPVNWNMEGCYDEQGNSDTEKAKEIELKERQRLIDNNASKLEIQRRLQENPLCGSEAFSNTNFNDFPVVELKQQLQRVKANNWQNTKGTPVEFYREEGIVKAKPILSGKANPIISLNHVSSDISGCPIIYEYPVLNAPKFLYKIGYDPVRQDKGTSLASIVVYKGIHIGSMYYNIIVAEYIGRKDSADDIDMIAEYFADFYNTQIMYENEVTSVKNYFRRIKRLNLLALQPDAVISKNVKNSKVARVYGCHMTTQLKSAAERYVKDWFTCILDYDENGNPIRGLERIYSIRLLEEAISYNRDGNFDYMSALFMCMFQVEEEGFKKEYTEKEKINVSKELSTIMNQMYKRK